MHPKRLMRAGRSGSPWQVADRPRPLFRTHLVIRWSLVAFIIACLVLLFSVFWLPTDYPIEDRLTDHTRDRMMHRLPKGGAEWHER